MTRRLLRAFGLLALLVAAFVLGLRWNDPPTNPSLTRGQSQSANAVEIKASSPGAMPLELLSTSAAGQATREVISQSAVATCQKAMAFKLCRDRRQELIDLNMSAVETEMQFQYFPEGERRDRMRANQSSMAQYRKKREAELRPAVARCEVDAPNADETYSRLIVRSALEGSPIAISEVISDGRIWFDVALKEPEQLPRLRSAANTWLREPELWLHTSRHYTESLADVFLEKSVRLSVNNPWLHEIASPDPAMAMLYVQIAVIIKELRLASPPLQPVFKLPGRKNVTDKSSEYEAQENRQINMLMARMLALEPVVSAGERETLKLRAIKVARRAFDAERARAREVQAAFIGKVVPRSDVERCADP